MTCSFKEKHGPNRGAGWVVGQRSEITSMRSRRTAESSSHIRASSANRASGASAAIHSGYSGTLRKSRAEGKAPPGRDEVGQAAERTDAEGSRRSGQVVTRPRTAWGKRGR